MEPVTIVLGRVSRGGDYADEESNGTANKHTAMGFWGGLPVAGSGLRVPQDSQVARRGRGRFLVWPAIGPQVSPSLAGPPSG